MTSINDMVSGVINRIDGIPVSVTGSPMIYEWLNDSRIQVNNYLSTSISEGSVPEAYQPVIKNLGAAYTLGYMYGVGVDFDYSIGDFSVKKGNSNNPVSNQLKFYLSQANMCLNNIRKDVEYKVTFS